MSNFRVKLAFHLKRLRALNAELSRHTPAILLKQAATYPTTHNKQACAYYLLLEKQAGIEKRAIAELARWLGGKVRNWWRGRTQPPASSYGPPASSYGTPTSLQNPVQPPAVIPDSSANSKWPGFGDTNSNNGWKPPTGDTNPNNSWKFPQKGLVPMLGGTPDIPEPPSWEDERKKQKDWEEANPPEIYDQKFNLARYGRLTSPTQKWVGD